MRVARTLSSPGLDNRFYVRRFVDQLNLSIEEEEDSLVENADEVMTACHSRYAATDRIVTLSAWHRQLAKHFRLSYGYMRIYNKQLEMIREFSKIL